VYAWEYQTTGIHSAPGVKQIVQTAEGAAERTFHIDGQLHSDPDLQDDTNECMDHICCICCSETILMVARESGIVHQYSLPMLTLETKDLLHCRPQVICSYGVELQLYSTLSH
jgi:WD repeat-containing protein 35